MVKNPPANVGDTGLIPGLGRSHRPRGQLSPELLCTTAIEPVRWSLRTSTTEAVLRTRRTQHSGEPVLCERAAPPAQTRAKPAQQQRPSPAKGNK